MAMKAKHAFGNSSAVQEALNTGKINAYDILFMDGDTEPKVGWIDKDGNFRLVKNETDLSGIEAELSTKANAEDVDAKISTAATDSVATAKSYTDDKVEAAINEHMVKKFEITDVPIGTLVRMNENEIRIMCPVDTEWIKQTVGIGGDANCYYATFKTFVPSDNVVGYIEHLGDQVDKEILTDFSTDKYGRRYQPTWLALAKYDESTGVWNYYGKNSSEEKFIGWDYQIDWYDVDGKVIASDCIRINLSNEGCHSSIKPYYGVSETVEIEGKVEEMVEEKMTVKIVEAVSTSNAYTDAQIEAKLAEIEEAVSYEIIEF